MGLRGPTARHLVAGGLLGLVVGLASWVDPLGYFRIAELKALNTQFDLRGPLPVASPIVIASIDETPFDALHTPWPWPREFHGKFLGAVNRGRPAAVAFDVLFYEPSARGDRDDTALAAAVARAGNVVLTTALATSKDEGSADRAGTTRQDLNPPLPIIRDKSADCVTPPPRRPRPSVSQQLPCGFGFANFDPDVDAFVRRVQLLRTIDGREFPSLSLLVLSPPISRSPISRSRSGGPGWAW